MKYNLIFKTIGIALVMLIQFSCIGVKTIPTINLKVTPDTYHQNSDTLNSAQINWKKYFADEQLLTLIDSALKNNQELNIALQEIEISKNEIRARKGEYLPKIGLGSSAGTEKSGKFTRNGAIEDQLLIKPSTPFPEPFSNLKLGADFKWEIDIWKKLRNAKKSAVLNYLATVEGKNFMVTNLISEIADTYFELLASKNLLDIIDKNIEIQTNALKTVKQQKDAAKVSQLAVNRFEAQLLNTSNLQYITKQKIIETENRLNSLTGIISQPLTPKIQNFLTITFDSLQTGVPPQLLRNRADIRKAEFELEASKLNVKQAKANFYPSLGISADIGFQAFNPNFLINPSSLAYNVVGDLMAPLINRNAIMANYKTANAKQIQCTFNYQKTILNAYLDVMNQVAKCSNFTKSVSTKQKEVDILTQSVGIANNLFNAARADYAEVLLTQREALDAKIELIEAQLNQLHAKVNLYRALGGGWR